MISNKLQPILKEMQRSLRRNTVVELKNMEQFIETLSLTCSTCLEQKFRTEVIIFKCVRKHITR